MYSPGDHRVMHDGLVGLVLEVAVPSALELRSRPVSHFCQLLLSRTDLHTSLNTVGSKRTSALEVPLIVDLLLNLRVAANKVIK